MRYTRTKSTCTLCPLRDRRRVWSEVPDGDVRIAVVAEAPGEAEAHEGRPLIGPAGSLWMKALKENGINRAGLWVSNVVCCQPPHNDMRSFEGVDALACCTPGFEAELKAMKARGVKIVALMGNVALKAAGFEGSISTMRGSVYEKDGMLFVPTLHPSAVLRGSGAKRDGSGYQDLGVFIHDWGKIKDIADNGWTRIREDFNLEPSLDDLRAFVKRVTAKKTLLYADTETTGLKWSRGARVVVLGLAESATKAISIPFLKEHGFPYWNGHSDEVHALVQSVFDNCPIVFQNCFFDVPLLRRAEGFRIDDASIAHDTLVLHSLVSPETRHDLAFITSVYGKTPEWKEVFKNRDKGILEMDQIEMRRYNLRDCVVLAQILPSMLAHLEKLGLTQFYNEETRRLIGPLLQMSEAGITFDVEHLEKFDLLLDRSLAEKLAEIREAYALPAEFDFGSDEELRYFLYGIVPAKFRQLRGTLVRYTKHLKSGDRADSKFFQGVALRTLKHNIPEADVLGVEEIASTSVKRPGTAAYEELHRLEIVRDFCKAKYTLSSWSPLKTDSGLAGVGAEALLAYTVQLNNRLESIAALVHPEKYEDEVSSIEDVISFIADLGQLSELQKLKSSFTKYIVDPDGRIRASWNIWGTATGRLSCSRPNLEQLPEHGVGKQVRGFFKAKPGYKLVSSDGENLEVALLGYDSLDPTIIDAYVNGKNIHDLNTKILYDIGPEHPYWKEGRAAAKKFQFGGMSYGGGDKNVHRKMVVEAPHLPLTLAQYREAKARWLEAHPAYVKWRATVEADVTSTRIVRNAFGRIRIFFGKPRDIVREAMNFRIQSAGACLINRAMIRVYDEVKRLGLDATFVLQIHDQLILEVREDQATEVAALLKREIERPFVMHGIERFVRADSTIGDTYADV